MLPLKTILLVIALVLLIASAFNLSPSNRINLLSAGLAVWVLSILVPV